MPGTVVDPRNLGERNRRSFPPSLRSKAERVGVDRNINQVHSMLAGDKCSGGNTARRCERWGGAMLSRAVRKASQGRWRLLGKIPSRPGKEAHHVESGEAGERGNSRSKGPEAEVGTWGWLWLERRPEGSTEQSKTM